jgi:hypothetical protein
MAHPAGADTATRFARTVLREHLNDRLCDVIVAEGQAEGTFLCECGDVTCQEFVTLPVATFNGLRAAWRPVLGHSPY